MTRATDTAARPPTRFAAGAGAARSAIRKRRNWIQLLQFCLVGASGYLVNVAVYALLVHAAGVPYLVAAVSRSPSP